MPLRVSSVSDGSNDVRFVVFRSFAALGVCFRELWLGVLLSLYRFVDFLVWLVMIVVCGPLVV